MLYLVAVGCIAVGAFWTANAERIVDGNPAQGRMKTKNPRDRQVVGARAFGVAGIVFGVVALAVAAFTN